MSPTELSATIAVRLYPVRATRASDVRVASFVVTLSGMTSDVDGALDLITPQGALYEHRPTAIGTALPTTQLDFPVAGTLIDQNQLTGHWTADFLVSGQPFASASFQLDP